MSIKKLIRLICIVLCVCLFLPSLFAYAVEDDNYRYRFDPNTEGFGFDSSSADRAFLAKVLLMEVYGKSKQPCTLWFADYDRSSFGDSAEALQQYKEKLASQLNIPIEDILNNDSGICYYITNISKTDLEWFKKEPLIDTVEYNTEKVCTVDIPEFNEKIEYLLETFVLDWKIPDDKKIPVAIWYNDNDWEGNYEKRTKAFNELISQYNQSDYTNTEWNSLVKEIETKVRREITMKCNADMAETFDIPEEDIVRTDFGRNLIWAYLGKSDILRLADDNCVTSIEYEEMIEPQSWTDDTCISDELLRIFDGSDKKYNVVITMKDRPEDSLSKANFFNWLYSEQKRSEEFADIYLTYNDTKCIGNIIYTELAESQIRGLDWVHCVTGKMSSIAPAGDLTKNDIPECVEGFPDIEYVFEASTSLKIQRMVLGLDTYEYDEHMDVDGDGILTNRDAMYILRSTIKLEQISPELKYRLQMTHFFNNMDSIT